MDVDDSGPGGLCQAVKLGEYGLHVFGLVLIAIGDNLIERVQNNDVGAVAYRGSSHVVKVAVYAA
jgi:hypothetical protein